MTKVSISLIFFLMLCFCCRAQTFINIEERENLRNHALDNVKELENVLNEIISSNNPEEKKRIVFNSKESIIDESAKIEDDLDPDKSVSNSSDFIDADRYFERLPLFFIPDNNVKPVNFSNIYVSNVRSSDYTYINVYFECLFSGTHKVTSKKFKKVLRLATIKLFSDQNKTITKIVTINFANTTDLSKIKKESIAFEKEFQNFQQSASYKQKLAEEGYKFFIEAADKNFANKEYETAKENYKNALKSKLDDDYASNKIDEIEKIQNDLKLEKSFSEKINDGDNDFKYKRYYEARDNYQLALNIKPNNSYALAQMSKIERKLHPRFPLKTTGYLGVNYTFFRSNINSIQNISDGLKSKFIIENFGLSFYYPIGLYVSSIKTFDEKIPDYHYSEKTVNEAKTFLLKSNINFTDLTYKKKAEHIAGFNAGLYFSFFRPIYFKVGLSDYFGSSWELASGDLKGKLNYSNSSSKLYAINYQSINKTNFQAGFAVVLPYFQLESTYDNLSQSVFISAGINYPFKKVYIISHNPNKQYRKKKYPYKTTKYISISYAFLNYDSKRPVSISNLTDNTFETSPLERLTFSFCQRFGFFISGFKFTFDKIPNFYYSTQEVNEKRTTLLTSQTKFTEINYIKTESNLTKFNLGVSYSFFRPLHFKVGVSNINGSVWDVYSGDFNYEMYKYNQGNYYAIDYKEINSIKIVGGIALVFPFFQMEIMYDDYYHKLGASLGLNIPVRKKQ